MRNDLSSIRSIVDDAFATRSLAGLRALLGFDEPALALYDLEGEVFYCGARGTMVCYSVHDCDNVPKSARLLRARNHTQLQFYLCVDAAWTVITVGSFGFGERLLTLTLHRGQVRPSDLEALAEMQPVAQESGTAIAARHAKALDRSRVTRRFFADFAAQRDAVAAAWSGPSSQQRRDRAQLALLLLSRLMFLYFLQHRGYLGGDRDYLIRRFRTWTSRKRTFYSGALKPLFFYVLNRRTAQRPERAAAYGDLPYLNGGLFERHALERKHLRLDLPDAAISGVFDDLLERYRFTARESSDAVMDGTHDLGIDPEMLGGVFEGLMAERTRETTGTFYTPAATVDQLVCNTLDAYSQPSSSSSRPLREVRILDPACGSGAFLLGALSRVAERRAATEGTDVMQARRDIVARSLYGVDLQGDAALLCALRLWLALVPGSNSLEVQPLPNLDRKIRQGDSLIDPLDLRSGLSSPDVRRCIAELKPASAAYMHSEPLERPALLRTLHRTEKRLATAWVNVQQQRVRYATAELTARAQQKDLFGGVTADARRARVDLNLTAQRAQELRKLQRQLRIKDERPFFSFAVHFPDAAIGGFDIILCNPPWVRSHNWPRSLSSVMRARFEVCRSNSWHPPHSSSTPRGGGNQIDLAHLFLERALDLLAPGGVLGIILPAKFMRSLSGAAARKLLLERCDIVSIEDHSLDQRSVFHADAFASLIVARKRDGESASTPVSVRMIRRRAAPLVFSIDQKALPLYHEDSRSPWFLVPPEVRRPLARMQQHPTIGSDAKLHVRRGVVSGANGVMLLDYAEPRLSGLCVIRSSGYNTATAPADFESVVEQSCVAPVITGSDLSAWHSTRQRFLLCRLPHAAARTPRLSTYLARHDLELSDVPKVAAPATAVAWHDLASTLRAVVLPPDVVALNTVYFISADDDTAHLLCAYFNSLPVRTFARAIAERAKDAHFRFFAWTISMLPLPASWRSFETKRLCRISRDAHAAGGISEGRQAELDAIVAKAYGLGRADVRALKSFDAWLRGL